MSVRGLVLMVVGAALLAVSASTAVAQDVGLTSRGPRFLMRSENGRMPPTEVSASSIAVLRRVVTMQLDRPTLGAVLTEIERQTGLRFFYAREVVAADRPVTLRAERITVAAALMEILVGADVDVVLSSGRQVALVRRAAGKVAATGTVVGRVTDVKTSDRLVNAEVYLDGTKWRTATGDNGYYKLADVEVGSYTLTVRRVGYAKQSRAVVVTAGQEVTADVALQPVVTQLNEIVTTVTGEQRVRELGHIVGRIDADSLMKEAPISSVSELLNARVPGLQVFTNSGVVGGTVSLRLRSLSSTTLDPAPIVVIDGVRYTTTALYQTGFDVEETSRLNDINPNDIETVEVVKGPSAATLYGTDAANGVIVITTKRGSAGETRWNGYLRASQSAIPKYAYQDSYYGWGTVFGTPNYPYTSCTLALIARNRCTQQDSVQRIPNPLNDPNNSFFHNAPSWQYGANTRGGRQGLQYYLSGDYDAATGPFQMPKAAIERIKQIRGIDDLPIEQLRPNAMSRLNLRANLDADIAPRVALQLSTGYIGSATRTLSSSASFENASSGNPTSPYGRYDPVDAFFRTSTEHLDRFIGTASGRWQPASWLQARMALGLDLANVNRSSLARRGDSELSSEGYAQDDRTRQLSVSGDLGLSAMLRRGRVSFRTSVGAQYVRSVTDGVTAAGLDLPVGGESPSQALTQFIYRNFDEQATLGGYAEETVGLNDRLFLTGAIRVDGATAFGQDYSAAVYPKVSASWVVSDEPFMPRWPWLDDLRLRYAFGASGKQAYSYMSLPDYSLATAYVDGETVNKIWVYTLGNPNLKPERVREHEFGFDASAFAGRTRLAVTWFTRKTLDPIVYRDLAPGYGTIYDNFGEFKGHGFEVELTLRPIESRNFDWQLTATHSLRRSVVVDLGTLSENKDYGGGYVEGYPLGARFGPTVAGYSDTDGNGIITRTEVQLSEPQYLGESTPPISQTLTSSFGLFNRRVRLSTLFERRAGYTQLNRQDYIRCLSGACKELIDLNTPLDEQAHAAVLGSYQPVEDGTFVRFRELTAAVDLPDHFARAMRVRAASLSLSVRNLALWSSFSGPDPESAPVNGVYGASASGVPQGRTYVLRFDVGL